MTKIPSTKAAPEYLPDLLKIIDRNTGNIENMKREIHEYLLNKSSRGKRNEYNSVYAIAFPTLKRLELIQNKGADVSLSQDGKLLLKRFNEKGLNEYKKLFAKILLRVDKEKAHVVGNLISFDKETASFEEIVNHLRENGVDTNLKDDRLRRWLRFLLYVDFIKDFDKKFIINKSQIKSIEKVKKPVNFDAFLDVLTQEYNKLKIKNRGNIYVKIPELERQVCEKIENFTTFDFREYLKKLKNHKIIGKKIIFSKPGARETGGIKIDNVYYYYISIYETGD